MKIGLDTAPVTLRGNYFQHLAGVLENYAPEHEYVVDAKRYGHLDLYHGFRSSLPLSVHLGRIPAVMTVPNLDFLRYPHLYTFSERLILREPGSGTRKILERELMQCGYTIEAFRANVCISSFKLIRHLVSEGCGVSFLYEAVVKNDAQFGHFSSEIISFEVSAPSGSAALFPSLSSRFVLRHRGKLGQAANLP